MPRKCLSRTEGERALDKSCDGFHPLYKSQVNCHPISLAHGAFTLWAPSLFARAKQLCLFACAGAPKLWPLQTCYKFVLLWWF